MGHKSVIPGHKAQSGDGPLPAPDYSPCFLTYKIWIILSAQPTYQDLWINEKKNVEQKALYKLEALK